MRGDPAGAGDGPAASPAVTSARRLRPRSMPTNSATNASARRRENAVRRVVLHQPPILHHGEPVAHADRLVDVVGDEDDGLAQPPQDRQELALQPLAHDRIDGAERLVHQHHRRIGRQRARDADPLPLAARKLAREAPQELAAARGRRASASPRRAPRSAASASRAGPARSRRSRRSSCAGTARPAG